MRERNLDCVLLGGLGNQLFQLSAALTLRGNRPITLLNIPGYCGHSVDDRPAIDEFALPDGVSIAPARNSQATTARLIGRIIRECHEESRTRSFLGRGAAYTFRQFGVVGQHALGDDSWIDGQHGFAPRFLFGFWQAWVYAEALRNYAALWGLRPKSSTSLEEQTLEVVSRERPVMVHVRLGDYRAAPAFGTLTTAYYRQSLRTLAVGEGESVWVFSDEPESARLLLSPLERAYNLCYPEIGRPPFRPSHLLDVLRWGRKYVIANSTLSWWGAFLSHEVAAPVAAPDPWFARSPEPIGLIPPTWRRVSR